jgi:hypothetical protein
VDVDHSIGVSGVKSRVIGLLPPLRSGGIFPDAGINADSGMIVSQWDRHPLPHAAPVFLHQPLGTVCAVTRSAA